MTVRVPEGAVPQPGAVSTRVDDRAMPTMPACDEHQAPLLGKTRPDARGPAAQRRLAATIDGVQEAFGSSSSWSWSWRSSRWPAGSRAAPTTRSAAAGCRCATAATAPAARPARDGRRRSATRRSARCSRRATPGALRQGKEPLDLEAELARALARPRSTRPGPRGPRSRRRAQRATRTPGQGAARRRGRGGAAGCATSQMASAPLVFPRHGRAKTLRARRHPQSAPGPTSTRRPRS